MDIYVPSAPKSAIVRRDGGFSLVEVTIAIGIVAFAFLAVFGLIPAGLNVSRQSMDMALAIQIAQRIVTNYQGKDFDLTIVKPGSSTAYSGSANMTWCDDPNYNQADFNAKRNKTARSLTKVSEHPWYSDTGGVLGMTTGAIYCVNVRVTPATAMPKIGGGALADNENLATVTVQVAYNPAQRDLAAYEGGESDSSKPMRNLWNGAFADTPTKTGVVPIHTYTARIARNR